MNETSVSVSPGNPMTVVAAWNYVRPVGASGANRNGFAASVDGGQIWTEYLQTGVPGAGDPMTAADPRTGTLWVGADFNAGFWVARWNGAGFDPPVTFPWPTSTDKPLMAAGPRPNQPNTTRLYVTFWAGFGTHPLTWSDDFGSTWEPNPVFTPNPPTHVCESTLPRIGPNGAVYIFTWDRAFGVYLLRSRAEDGAGRPVFDAPIRIATRLDWWPATSVNQNERIPGSFNAAPFTSGAVDPVNGTLYCVFIDSTAMTCTNGCQQYDVDMYFTKSPTAPGQIAGDTWSTPRRILGNDGPPYDQFFPWLEVDQNGRLHLLFLDTRGTAHSDTDYPAQLRTQYAYSTNDGDTWSESTIAPHWTGTPPPPAPAVWPFSDVWCGEYIGLAATSTRVDAVYPATRGPDVVLPEWPPEERIWTNVITWP